MLEGLPNKYWGEGWGIAHGSCTYDIGSCWVRNPEIFVDAWSIEAYEPFFWFFRAHAHMDEYSFVCVKIKALPIGHWCNQQANNSDDK